MNLAPGERLTVLDALDQIEYACMFLPANWTRRGILQVTYNVRGALEAAQVDGRRRAVATWLSGFCFGAAFGVLIVNLILLWLNGGKHP